jgi:hypothetical protein
MTELITSVKDWASRLVLLLLLSLVFSITRAYIENFRLTCHS